MNESLPPLFIACCKGNSRYLKSELESTKPASKIFDELDFCDLSGQTCLHVASHRGHDEIVEILTSHPKINLNLNARNIYGSTPLHLACFFGHSKIVEMLLNALSNPVCFHPTDIFYDTPLHLACIENHIEIIKLFLKFDPSIAIDRKGRAGKTPIHLACQNGNVKMLRLLMSTKNSQCDYHCQDNFGLTPLETMAFKSIENESMSLLLDSRPSCMNK